jgi:hypothetical protein
VEHHGRTQCAAGPGGQVRHCCRAGA